jgi:hypothetical protein
MDGNAPAFDPDRTAFSIDQQAAIIDFRHHAGTSQFRWEKRIILRLEGRIRQKRRRFLDRRRHRVRGEIIAELIGAGKEPGDRKDRIGPGTTDLIPFDI